MTDERNIVSMLASSPKPWNTNAIAKRLSQSYPRHSTQSYQTHLNKNLESNKQYALRVERLKRDNERATMTPIGRAEEPNTSMEGALREEIMNEVQEQVDNANGAVPMQDASVQANLRGVGRLSKTPSPTMDQSIQADIPDETKPVRKFTSVHTDRLVQKLSTWLKTYFQTEPSSQEGVAGFLQLSQDSLEPPEELFTEISMEVR
jgi:hypothetical protein